MSGSNEVPSYFEGYSDPGFLESVDEYMRTEWLHNPSKDVPPLGPDAPSSNSSGSYIAEGSPHDRTPYDLSSLYRFREEYNMRLTPRSAPLTGKSKDWGPLFDSTSSSTWHVLPQSTHQAESRLSTMHSILVPRLDAVPSSPFAEDDNTNHDNSSLSQVLSTADCPEAAHPVQNRSTDAKNPFHRRRGIRNPIQRRSSDRQTTEIYGPVHLRHGHGLHSLKRNGKLDRKAPQILHAEEVQPPSYEWGVTSQACNLWLETNQNATLTQNVLHTISKLYHIHPTQVHECFKNMSRDSAHQTMRHLDEAILSKYQHRRSTQRCATGTAAAKGDTRDPIKRFSCTLRCGRTFKNKGNWEKHERTHYPQDVWVCCKSACRDLEPFTRKDHFSTHLISMHDYEKEQILRELYNESNIKIDSRFSRYCHVPNCSVHFDSWKARTDHFAEHFKEDYNMSTWNPMKDETRIADDCSVSYADKGACSKSSDMETNTDGDTSVFRYYDYSSDSGIFKDSVGCGDSNDSSSSSGSLDDHGRPDGGVAEPTDQVSANGDSCDQESRSTRHKVVQKNAVLEGFASQ